MTGDPRDDDGDNLWVRLRRRKVVQWGLAYAAAAWALLQVFGFAADSFGWPATTKQLAILAFAAGLPIAVVLAWYHGDRGYQRATRSELAIIAAILAIGAAALWQYWRVGETAGPLPVTAPSGPALEKRPSIAVLPFENRSSKQDDAFFVEGIHDDILTQLSKVSALRVISRTSVERYRETRLPVKEIARQLGVTSILEGGVQRAGDRVRINVQLIDAATDMHLWAETYDRELTLANIFDIQGELASAIASALRATLTTAEKARVGTMPTRSLDAWEAYQLGRQRQRGGTTESLKEAEAMFRKAVALDDRFALAYVGLAESLFSLAYRGAPQQATLQQSREALAKANALAPELSEAHAAAGKLAESRGDYKDAEAEYAKAIELNENNATATLRYAYLIIGLGRQKKAVELAERAVKLDPMSVATQTNLGVAFVGVGRFRESVQQFEKAISVDPTVPVPYLRLADIYAKGLGRFDEAVRWQRKLVDLDPNDPACLAMLAGLYMDLGETDAARQWLDAALKGGVRDATTAETASLWHLYRGESVQSVDYARRAFEISPRHSFALTLLRDHDLAADDPQRARERYAQIVPELLASELPAIDGTKFQYATDLAAVLQRTGEPRRAAELLEGSLRFARTLPRMGFLGRNMIDVQVLALQGQRTAALVALKELAEAGYAYAWRYYRDFDPNLATIRDDPAFTAAFAVIEANMARQRAQLAARPVAGPAGAAAPAQRAAR